MSNLTNHCENHKQFIPSCKACKTQRDSIVKQIKNTANVSKGQPNGTKSKLVNIKEEEEKILVSFRKEMAHLKFTLPFEKIFIIPENYHISHLYFIIMEEQGYEFKTELNLKTRENVAICLIFQKIK